jgi:hypothetical protein
MFLRAQIWLSPNFNVHFFFTLSLRCICIFENSIKFSIFYGQYDLFQEKKAHVSEWPFSTFLDPTPQIKKNTLKMKKNLFSEIVLEIFFQSKNIWHIVNFKKHCTQSCTYVFTIFCCKVSTLKIVISASCELLTCYLYKFIHANIFFFMRDNFIFYNFIHCRLFYLNDNVIWFMLDTNFIFLWLYPLPSVSLNENIFCLMWAINFIFL